MDFLKQRTMIRYYKAVVQDIASDGRNAIRAGRDDIAEIATAYLNLIQDTPIEDVQSIYEAWIITQMAMEKSKGGKR